MRGAFAVRRRRLLGCSIVRRRRLLGFSIVRRRRLLGLSELVGALWERCRNVEEILDCIFSFLEIVSDLHSELSYHWTFFYRSPIRKYIRVIHKI